MYFWKRDLDLDRMFSNVKYHIQEPYDHGFLPNTNVTQEVRKVSFAEPIFHMGCHAGGSGKRPLVRPEENPVSLMSHPISKFFQPGEIVFDVCMGTESTAKACLLATENLKFFGCEANEACLSDSMASIL